MKLRPRVDRLEAKQPDKDFKPAMTFIWAGSHNDAALEEAKLQAEAKGCRLIVIELVPAYRPDEDPGIQAGLQHRD